MLVRIDGEWIDPGMVAFVFEAAMDGTGAGGNCTYRGEPGFVAFDSVEGGPVLVNARCVVALHTEGDGTTEVETDRGLKVTVQGLPDWVALVLNKSRHLGRVA